MGEIHSARIYFLDVGQGTCQVIEFSDGNLVIIDCGENARALVSLLKTIRFKRIRAVVLSHWDKDHVVGTHALLEDFSDRIDAFYLPEDRPAKDILSNTVYRRIKELADEKVLVIERLEYRDSVQGLIYRVRNGPRLSVLYPNFQESLEVKVQPDANQGSGILLLEYKKSKILFPGDAGKMAFQSLAQRYGSQPLSCNIMTAPHHSGKLNRGASKFPGFDNCYQWLYKEVVCPEFVIVSTGTDNGYGHPIKDHVAEILRAGSKVICTQLTLQCHKDVEKFRPSVLPQLYPAACRFGDGVGCGGTVMAKISAKGVSLRRLREHGNLVREMGETGSPLCLSSPS